MAGINYQVGILVHGDNHFIVRGPLPDRATALALVRRWSVIQIANATREVGGNTPPDLYQCSLDWWSISTKEFRENLEWAVVVPGENETSPAVAKLLDELARRGVDIHNTSRGSW